MRRVEKNICPQHFQDRVTAVGGLNRYGEPNFKVVWLQTPTMRAGGYWDFDGFYGYRDVPMHGEPAWGILQWNAPEVYGTPELYYMQNVDETTGLAVLGEYPYKGRYEVLFVLSHKEMVNNKLIVEHMPLNNMLIDKVIPVVLQAKNVSLERKRAAQQELKDREDREQLETIEAMRADAKMAFGGNAVSFSRQGCRTSIIDRKVKDIEKNLAKNIAMLRRLGKGTSVR
jgi:hypothetical protein